VTTSARAATPGEGSPATSELDAATPGRLLRLFGSVVAPATLLTALMYYFGVLHAYWFFGTFGVDYTVFELGPEDYLFRSADGLFVPITFAAVALLAAIWGWRLLPDRLLAGASRPGAQRAAVVVLAAAGGVLTAVAVVGVLVPRLLLRWVGLPGLSLAAGALLLLCASRLHWRLRRRRWSGPGRPVAPRGGVMEWAAVLALVSVGLFWATGDWSAAVGTTRGEQVVAQLPNMPSAVVYSQEALNLGAAEVGLRTCGTPGDAFSHRYEGLKLILQSGGHYLFLPDTWTWESGTAVVLPVTETVRVEYVLPGQTTPGC
jgi:hypothetical protein